MTTRRTVALALTTSIALAGLATATAASGAPPVVIAPQAVTNTSAYAIIKTIKVDANPIWVAVDGDDDSVYVTSDDSDTLAVFDGLTGDRDDTITVNDRPQGVAVNQRDDTVYVTNIGSKPGLAQINYSLPNPGTDDTLGFLYLSQYRLPYRVAVDQSGDDTLYVTTSTGNVSLYRVNPRSLSTVGSAASSLRGALGVAVNDGDDTVYWTIDDTANQLGWANERYFSFIPQPPVSVGQSPAAVAVNQRDDTVYVNNRLSSTLSVLNGATVQVDDTIALGPNCNAFNAIGGIAVDQHDDTVYVACTNQSTMYTLDSDNLDDTENSSVFMEGGGPGAIAVDDTGINRGILFVTSNTIGAANMWVVAPRVAPQVLTPSGSAGDPVTITLDIPNLSPTMQVDANTVKSVTFGTQRVTNQQQGTDDTVWTVLAPPGSGTVDVVVEFRGFNKALAGTYTYSSSPPPPAGDAPGAPTDVTATAGAMAATVSWTPPVDPGSFPITDYQVISSPDSRTCLVKAPATTCTVTGLSSSTSYTFRARALNGVGWGLFSPSSNAVTPEPPATVPGRVRALRVVAVGTEGTVTLGWRAPLDDGGAEITGYRVSVRQVGTQGYVRVRPDVAGREIVVSGLVPGRSYWFRVRAGNAAGFGPAERTSERVRIP